MTTGLRALDDDGVGAGAHQALGQRQSGGEGDQLGAAVFHRTHGGWDAGPYNGFVHGELIHKKYVSQVFPGDIYGNRRLVLNQLRDVPDARRGAAFVSACALVSASGETVVRGEWAGHIVREPRGDGGFGYDPIFVPDGSERSAAELSPAEKDAESHRGRALALLLPALRA